MTVEILVVSFCGDIRYIQLLEKESVCLNRQNKKNQWPAMII